jgi:alpha-glucosidase (family GH31 glycosyl hydrolase)
VLTLIRFYPIILGIKPFDLTRFSHREVNKNKQKHLIDYHDSVSMGFFFPETHHMYGLPERAYSHRLPTTETNGPYRIFNIDLNPLPDSPVGLYAGVPYLTGHGIGRDASIAWMNSADTFVQILNAAHEGVNGTFSSFVSSGGSLEFFVWASRQSPKTVQSNVNTITGYPSMPPAFSLGFHFSKWNAISIDAKTMIERNFNFT